MIKLKDFILDEIPDTKCETKRNNKTEFCFTLEYENDSDFILKKTTKTTEKLLVCLVSQGQIYIKNNKTNEIEKVDKLEQIKKFKIGMSEDQIPDFQKLQWEPFSTCWGEVYSDWATLLYDVDACKELMNMKLNPFKDERLLAQYRGRKEAFMKEFEYVKALQLLNSDVKITDLKNLLNNMRMANITYNNIRDNLETLNELGWKSFVYIFNAHNAHLMLTEYRCDFKRLIEWLVYTVKNKNHLTMYYTYSNYSFSINDYLDYLNMQYQMYGKVKEKYPEHWLSDKHVMNIRYNEWKKLHNNTTYKIHQEKLADVVAYENKKYKIVTPLTNTDILDEADQQKHCVASYVDKIVNGETNIVFIRDKVDLDTSLLTVEIRSNKICQVRGFQNRYYTKEEYDFMKEWAHKTGLELIVQPPKE